MNSRRFTAQVSRASDQRIAQVGGPHCTAGFRLGLCQLGVKSGKALVEQLTSGLSPTADMIADIVLRLVSAMCGRLRVGKENLHVALLVGAAMCSAYLARFT